jgi:hypothetical protein
MPFRLASSTSRLSTAEAPPGCVANHSHCLGSNVTSRATTPNLGRPRPLDSEAPSFPCSNSVVRSATQLPTTARGCRDNLLMMSAFVPRKSRSTTRPVVSSKTRNELDEPFSTAVLTASATSINGPDTSRREPSKAVAGFERMSDTHSDRELCDVYLYPEFNLWSIFPGFYSGRHGGMALGPAPARRPGLRKSEQPPCTADTAAAHGVSRSAHGSRYGPRDSGYGHQESGSRLPAQR